MYFFVLITLFNICSYRLIKSRKTKFSTKFMSIIKYLKLFQVETLKFSVKPQVKNRSIRIYNNGLEMLLPDNF